MKDAVSAIYEWYLELVYRFFKGVFRCGPLSETCSIDWTAWATIAAAAMLIFSWFAAAKSVRTAIRLRNAEWKRAGRLERKRRGEEAKERSRATGIQAKVVVDETFAAIAELRGIQELLRKLDYENAEATRQVLGVPLRRSTFFATERIVDSLGGFSEADEVSILYAVRTWKTLPIFAEGAPPDMPYTYFLQRKVQIDANLEAVIREFNGLRKKLRPYVEKVDGVSIVTTKEVRDAKEKVEEDVRVHHRVLYTHAGKEYENPSYPKGSVEGQGA
ncbi:hypothetical protein JY456_03780 [Stenotrophomonas maltophilia]|nr:hypothetical protein [Stenotrophomonas maltophilia]